MLVTAPLDGMTNGILEVWQESRLELNVLPNNGPLVIIIAGDDHLSVALPPSWRWWARTRWRKYHTAMIQETLRYRSLSHSLGQIMNNPSLSSSCTARVQQATEGNKLTNTDTEIASQ